LKSDERLSATSVNPGDVVPLATHRQFDTPGYRRSVINPLTHASVYYSNTPPLEDIQNDQTALQAIADQQLALTNRQQIHGTVTCVLGPFAEYTPGTEIDQILNRLTFNPRPVCVRVVYDLANLHVNLTLDSRAVPTVVRMNTEDRSRDERRVGIVAGAVSGGNQINYLPGQSQSQRNLYRNTGLGGGPNAISNE
jgi:hypothetical protein